jgi:hypothetical protein
LDTIAVLAVSLSPGFDPISGQPIAVEAPTPSMTRRLAYAGGKHMGRLLGDEFVRDMANHIGRRLNEEGRTCDDSKCSSSIGQDCCAAPIVFGVEVEPMTCRNNWDVVEVGGGCSLGGAGRAYTCCEPSMVGLIIVIVVFAVIVLGTILGIVLCCVYCKCCKECCGCGGGSSPPPPTMNPGVIMQQHGGVAMQPVGAQPAMNFDPVTGQPLQPAMRFDPNTGQPLQPAMAMAVAVPMGKV